MARDVYEAAFIRVGEEVAGKTANDMAKIVLQRATEFLEKGLMEVIRLHNARATREDMWLRLLPKQCEAFGKGHVVFREGDIALLRRHEKYGKNSAAVPLPILDLRIREAETGCAVIHVKYGGKSDRPTGFDTLAFLHIDSLPFLDVHDHQNILQTIKCAFDNDGCPQGLARHGSRKKRRPRERHLAS